MDDQKGVTPMGQVIQIDEGRIRDHLGEMVRGTVEEALNAMLDAEADRLCGAARYERSESRRDTRAGCYERALHTKAGEVTLKVPKLRRQTFETAIIERYRRRESSVEEALIEMYLAGVSVRRVEDITEALWGTRVSPSTVSSLNRKIYAKIDEWRHRPIEGDHPYLYLDGIVMKRTWAGEVRNVSLLVASAVNAEGYREILGICEGAKEDKSGWSAFLRHLVDRGLSGVQLVISDACRGLVESVAEFLPETLWQRCMVHFYRNVFSHVPAMKVREVAHMLKAIHAQESRQAAQEKAEAVEADLRRQKLTRAAELVAEHIGETLTYYAFPDVHWAKIRTNNPLERIMKEIRRRTRVVGAFPDGQSCLNLAAARLRHIAGSQWSARRYMNMEPLHAMQASSSGAVA
ncbi:transposase-like protein [Roseospira marina]|nr:transposase-like protein [Roseospira marina]MBB5089481.1 transposase-like protein [Roseospira marina]